MSIIFLQEGDNLKVTLNEMEFVMPNRLDTDENRLLAKKHVCLLWSQRRAAEIGDFTTESNWREDTYMNGSVEKIEHKVSSTEGQSIVSELRNTWPDEVENYESCPYNLVAEFGPEREPYQNDSISWYDLGNAAADSYKTSFSLPYSTYETEYGYGLKFDKTTQNVLAKIAVSKETLLAAYPGVLDSAPLPAFWDMYFCARIHSKDGSVDDRIDLYQNCPPSLMKEWCDENGYTFPYDIADDEITNKISLFGIVYNTSTNTVEHVKAYTRVFE